MGSCGVVRSLEGAAVLVSSPWAHGGDGCMRPWLSLYTIKVYQIVPRLAWGAAGRGGDKALMAMGWS